jgi:2-polyprenyl-3-methyl-5-hydroxy-6-metoxy-1,4-benzoquinol methylase
MTQAYDDKNAAYFGNARVEIEPLLSPSASRVLEIGCGTGQTVRWLKESGRAGQAWGVELFESAAKLARPHFEEVLVGDAESLVDTAFTGQEFDLILCLDVLEHMVDPWRCVATLQSRIAPGGKLVISVPNVRCLRVIAPLLLLGEWKYLDEGILDRTHLRFFTRKSAQQLAAGSAFQVERCLSFRPANTKIGKLNRWTLGIWDDLTAVQYLVAASAPAAGASSPSHPLPH